MGLNEALADLENFVKGSSPEHPQVSPEFPQHSTNEEHLADQAMKAISERWFGPGPAPQRQGNLHQIMQENERRFQEEQKALWKAQEQVPALMEDLLRSFHKGGAPKFRINKPFSLQGEVMIDPMSGSALSGPEYQAAMKDENIPGMFQKSENYPTDYREYLLEGGLEMVLKAAHSIGHGIFQLHFEDHFGRNHEFTSDGMAKFFMNTERVNE